MYWHCSRSHTAAAYAHIRLLRQRVQNIRLDEIRKFFSNPPPPLFVFILFREMSVIAWHFYITPGIGWWWREGWGDVTDFNLYLGWETTACVIHTFQSASLFTPFCPCFLIKSEIYGDSFSEAAIRKVAHFHIIKIYGLIFSHHYAAASAPNSITRITPSDRSAAIASITARHFIIDLHLPSKTLFQSAFYSSLKFPPYPKSNLTLGSRMKSHFALLR